MGLGSSGGRSTQDRGVGVKWGYPGNQNPKQGGGEMRGKEIRVIKTIFLILISIAFSFPTSPCFKALFAGVRRGKLGSLPGKNMGCYEGNWGQRMVILQSSTIYLDYKSRKHRYKRNIYKI